MFDATYVTLLDTTTVTTSAHENETYPWVCITNNGILGKNETFRITFNNTEYIIIADSWHASLSQGKGVSFIGNANLWENTWEGIDGYIGKIYDIPFLFTTLINNNTKSSQKYDEGLYLFTQNVGTYSIKIEAVIYDFNMLPNELLYGFALPSIRTIWDKNRSSYKCYSIGGGNAFTYQRAGIAIGFHNQIKGDSAKAFGSANVVSGEYAIALGGGNTVSGSHASTLGYQNTASGQYSLATGWYNTSSENCTTAIGCYNTASAGYAIAGGYHSTASGGLAIAIGYEVIAKHLCQTAIGMYNVADPSIATAGDRGNYIEIVGNGTSDNARSNARTLDWNGNESLAGGITLGKGTADEVTLTAVQLKQLKQLINA